MRLLQYGSHVDQLPLGGEPAAADMAHTAGIDELFEKQPGLSVTFADHRVRPLTA